MKPRWQRRLDAARARVLADGPDVLACLTSPLLPVRNAMLDILIAVGWREEHFLNAYFHLLMRENRRG